MPHSNDPYSDFVTRIVNSCRIALDSQGSMNDGEVTIVKAVRDTLCQLDPAIDPDTYPRHTIIIR